MNLPKFPHSAMFVGSTNVGKLESLLRLIETLYKNHFEFIVICAQQFKITRHSFLGNGSFMIRTFSLCATWKENQMNGLNYLKTQ